MKHAPYESEILRRMAPGVLSRAGFLGSDVRSLQEILDTDRSTVQSLGLTHERIADCLDEAARAAIAALGRPVDLAGGRLRAVYCEAMGLIPCPWADGTRRPTGELLVTEPARGRQLRYTPLSVHMIRRHGFYEGRGSTYRLDPALVADIFRLEAEPG